MASGPFAGLRVLDLSRVLAGPYSTMLLGDLGADVIKVERPGAGDDTRQWGPPDVDGESAYYLSVNRNKKSVAINLQTPEGIEVLRGLARQSDVLVENFRLGLMDEWGLGYKTVAHENPRLIYCSITSFGSGGPYAELPGYDFIIQGIGGIMSITGEPGGPPLKVGVAIVDLTAGMFLLGAIGAALYAREKTGEGQRIEVSLLDAQIAWLANQGGNFLYGGLDPGRLGNAHPNIVPYQTFKAHDRYFNLAVGNEKHWQKLCRVIGRTGWLDDTRFGSNRARVEHREELIANLTELFAEKTANEWLDALRNEGVPCGPINTIREVFDDPHVRATGVLQQVEHPKLGTLPQVRNPVRMSATPASIRSAPPMLGQHTEEVLQGLGYSPGALAGLRQKGVI